MKKMTALFVAGLFCLIATAQVGIGTTSPNSSAALDVQSNNKGVLIPRVALIAANTAAPVSSPADALLVYNTATAGTGGNTVAPGFYYWNASNARWVGISSGKTNNSENIGFGTWGDCATNAIVSEYLPTAASDGRASEKFGQDVAISGNWAIVGAPNATVTRDGITRPNQGAAYIYFFDGNTWQQQQKLVASSGTADDFLGTCVSISGNFAVVGSPDESLRGAAYVYFFNGTSWMQQQRLSAIAGNNSDQFGTDVSIEGNTIVVGASLYNKGTVTDAGAAYVFVFNGSSWVQQQRLEATDGASGDRFGTSVSLSGDRMLIGSPRCDGSATDQGAAYVFSLSGGTWTQQQKLTVSSAPAGAEFGMSVSLSPDYAVIGAPATTTTLPGTVYVFASTGSAWPRVATLTSIVSDDLFGSTVYISGDHILIGAASDHSANPDQGASYIYQNTAGIWRRLQKLIEPSSGTSDKFGTACAVDGRRFLIGAPGYSTQRGMAFFGKIN